MCVGVGVGVGGCGWVWVWVVRRKAAGLERAGLDLC